MAKTAPTPSVERMPSLSLVIRPQLSFHVVELLPDQRALDVAVALAGFFAIERFHFALHFLRGFEERAKSRIAARDREDERQIPAAREKLRIEPVPEPPPERNRQEQLEADRPVAAVRFPGLLRHLLGSLALQRPSAFRICFSVKVCTPSSCARSSFEPDATPTTRKSVFFETDPVTRAPPSLKSCSISSRSIESVPVTQTVFPVRLVGVPENSGTGSGFLRSFFFPALTPRSS